MLELEFSLFPDHCISLRFLLSNPGCLLINFWSIICICISMENNQWKIDPKGTALKVRQVHVKIAYEEINQLEKLSA